MKNINILSILILGLFLTNCSKEDRNCTKTDFIGEFVGTTLCKVNGATGQPVPTVIEIRSGSGENELLVNIDAISITVTIDGCSFSGVDQNADVDVRLSGSLNGNDIKVELEGVAFNSPLDCESNAERV